MADSGIVGGTLGRNRPAREIEPDEVTDVIRPSMSAAPAPWRITSAAYTWSMKSEHDYRTTSPRRFSLVYNPAAGIPTEPKNIGSRWLVEDEFVRLYRWLECPDAPALECHGQPDSVVIDGSETNP